MRDCLILGCGRSGTSMLAGCFFSAGYYMGSHLIEANEQNPKGFFESYDIEAINEDILESVIRRRPKGVLKRFFRHRPRRSQYWLAEVPLGAPIRANAEVAARIEEMVARRPFCFKDPRFCYTLPAWRPFLGDALYLVVFREVGRTVQSILTACARQPYLRDLKMDAARALRVWTLQYAHILRQHATSGEWVFLHYDQILNGSALPRLAALVAAPLNADFPDSSLRRSADTIRVPAQTQAVYAELCRRAGYEP